MGSQGLRVSTIVLLVSVLILGGVVPALAQKMGVTFLAGGGLFVASEKDYYAGIKADLYPEIGVLADISMIRVGVKFGLIYRKVELTGWGSGGGWDYYYYEEFTLAYIPAQLEFLIAPFPGDFTPYVGVMAGAFFAVGDNDEHHPAFSVKAGIEGRVDMLMIYGDIRYTHAKSSDLGINVGGVMLVAGVGLRFGS